MIADMSSNFGLIGLTISLIVRFLDFRVLARICLFTPTFMLFWGHISLKWRHRSSYPKSHLLRKHVVWVIKWENGSSGTTCVRDRGKNEKTGQDRTVKKVTKALYFIQLGRSPQPTDLHQNLHGGGCCPRHNYVREVWDWNFQGLRFYRVSNFRFSYWFLHGPYNSAALLRCLILANCAAWYSLPPF